MATVEAVGSHSDGEYLHAAEIKNWRHAMGGAGVLDDTLSLTVTEANRVITVPAFTAWVPDGNGALVYVSHAGGNVNVTASASNPRMDLLTLDASGNLGMQDGVATAETGDVEEAPLPSLDDDEILIATVRSPANQSNVLAANVRGRAVQVAQPTVMLAGSSSAATSTTSTSAVDLVTISGLSIAAAAFIESQFNYRKTAAAATMVGFGLKVNSTVVVEATTTVNSSLAACTSTQEVQDGICSFSITPRRTNYQGGILSIITVHTTTTARLMQVQTTLLANPIPTATITSMAIRAINDTASNAAEVTDWKIWTR